MFRFNLRQLEAFVATAEEGSFTLAAQKLFLTQSTVSTHILSLEQTLGVQLINRSGRKKVTLTKKGQQVYQQAAEILSSCQTLWQNCQTEKGILSIAGSTIPAQHLVPALMGGYLKQHTKTQFRFHHGDSTAVHEMLASGMAHIGFVGTMLDQTGFDYTVLGQDQLVVIAANTPENRRLQQSGAQGDALLDQPMILRNQSSGTQREFEAYLKSQNRTCKTMNVVARMDHPESIKSAVMQGMAVAVVSQISVQEQGGELLSFPLAQQGVTRNIYLVTDRASTPTAEEKRFIRYTIEHAKNFFSATKEQTQEKR